MPNYNFLNLSPIEFEDLVRDILQEYLGIHLECFTSGRDQGIDLRYSECKDNDLIIQCKRYKNYKGLISDLKKERKKVEDLKPSKYLLATSCGLSPANKNEIIDLFKGHIKNTGDIYGRNDLNNLLSKYKEIEKRHFKLWLTRTNILDNLINREIINRSDFENERIRRDVNIYVQNDSFKEAIDILDDSSFVIISGIPGIGKTTLARMLIYHYVNNNFELAVISRDISEGAKLFQRGKKQIFYYDDFLGTNFFNDNLPKNEDMRIIDFIDKIKKSKKKRMIFTTREYILKQAKDKYEKFDHSGIDIFKCVIDLEKYTKLIRAKILYNHLYFSKLQTEYIKEIVFNNRYLEVINHDNYNPRIIEFITDNTHTQSIVAKDYFDFVIRSLDFPMDIWKHAFEKQISKISRYVLYALLVSYDLEEIKFVEITVKKMIDNERNMGYDIKLNRGDFEQSIKELELTFIKYNIFEEKTYVSFQNNSIRDFLINYIRGDNNLIRLLLESAIFIVPLINIFTLDKKKDLKKIVLVDEMALFFEELVKRKIDYWNYKYPKEFLIEYRGIKSILEAYSKIEKYSLISEFFNVDENESIREILVEKFNNFDLERYKFFINIASYIILLNRLFKYTTIDRAKILKLFFEANLSFDDLKSLCYLKDLFNEDEADRRIFYQLVKEENSRIEYIIEKEVKKYLKEPNEELKSELLFQVEYIEKQLDIGLDIVKYELEESFLEDDLEDNFVIDTSFDDATDIICEDEQIRSMFNALLVDNR